MPTAPHLGMQVQRYKILVALATFRVEILVKKCQFNNSFCNVFFRYYAVRVKRFDILADCKDQPWRSYFLFPRVEIFAPCRGRKFYIVS